MQVVWQALRKLATAARSVDRSAFGEGGRLRTGTPGFAESVGTSGEVYLESCLQSAKQTQIKGGDQED
jgi:hypothetical protein